MLHAFQKKSKKGARTAKAEIDLLTARLRRVGEIHAAWLETQKGEGGRDGGD